MSNKTSSLRVRSLRGLTVIAMGLLCNGAVLAQGSASATLFPGATGPASASARSDYTQVELISDAAALVPGQSVWLGLKLTHAPHWHSYWRNPGDSGAPTTLSWTLPSGYTAGEIQWPYPQRIPVAHLANYGYEGENVFPVALQVPADAPAGQDATLTVEVNWLECADVCIPANATLALTLPVAPAGGAASMSAAPGEVQRALATKVPTPWPATAGVTRAVASATHLLMRIPGADWRSAEFFPYTEQLVHAAYVQPYAVADGGATLQLRRAEGRDGPWPESSIAGVVVVRTADGQTRAHSLDAAVVPGNPTLLPETSAGTESGNESATEAGTQTSTAVAPAPSGLVGSVLGAGLLAALVLAFLGGLVLNLMPCVFPVLAIKSLAVIGQPAAQRRAHALGYAAGVWLSMLALAGLLLALRAMGQGLGWGFQLQSPGFVAAMAVLFLLLALNLAGVFDLGGSVQRGAGDLAARLDAAPPSAWRRHGAALADGALAVAIATPCTAPFMGAALGYAMQASTSESLAVFSALALGLAAPVVLLTSWPALARRLPRPGPWMATLKTLFAFPLLATVVWLVWVLGQQTSIDTVGRFLGALVLVALAAWVWGQRGRLPLRVFGSSVAGVLAVALAAPGLNTTQPDGARASGVSAAEAAASAWQAWSPGEVTALRAQGMPVFVDYTAAWCITCQVNKKTVLETDGMQATFRAHGVTLMRADWTRRDADITRSLQELGRSGVPVYVLYGRDGQARVLPELLTAGVVEEALKESAPVATVPVLPPS